MSLRLQLIGTIAIVLLATLGLGALLVHWHAVQKIETEMSAALAVGTRIARKSVDAAEPVAEPRRRLQLLVADFDGDRHVRAVAVGPDGRVLFASKPATGADPAPRWLEHWLGQSSRKARVELPAAFDGHGAVFLEADSRNEIAEVWDDLLVYAKLLGVYSAGGLGVTLLVLAHAMRPLRDVNIALTRIGAGDFSAHLPETGPTELVSLASGFNAMTQRLAQAESRNTQLVDQLSRVQEEERVELSRNLHDEVSPLLFSVDVDAGAIKRLSGEGRTGEIADKARAIQAAVQAMKRNVRGIIEQLRPVHADAQDWDAQDWRSALGEMVEFWQQRFPGVAFRLDIGEVGCPSEVAVALKYLTNEGIGNALKHATPRSIDVTIARAGGEIVATVRDDGGGLRSGGSRQGYGLVGMRERVARAGGMFAMRAIAEPAGVEISARFPLPPTEAGPPTAGEGAVA